MTGYIFGTGGGSGTDVSDTTLLQNEAITGKYFYLADGTKVQGTMPIKEGITAQPTTSEQTLVPAGTYAKGDQKIAAIKTQTKTVTPNSSQQIITPSSGYYLSRVTVNEAKLKYDNIRLRINSDEYDSYSMIFSDIGFTPYYLYLSVHDFYSADLMTSRTYLVSICGYSYNDPYSEWECYALEYSFDDDFDWRLRERSFDGVVTWNGTDLSIESNGARFITVSSAEYICDLLGF